MTDLLTQTEKQAEKQEASDMNRDPITGAPGSHPVGTGVGAVGGMAAGVAVGAVVGPVGSLVAGAVGAVVGGLAGKGIGESVNPTAEDQTLQQIIDLGGVAANDQTGEVLIQSDDEYWQRAFITEPYYNKELIYDDYGPAYRAGYTDRLDNASSSWDIAESTLQSAWDSNKGASRLDWDEARHPMRAAWYRADNGLTGSGPFGIN